MSDWLPIKTAPMDGTRILASWPKGKVVVVEWNEKRKAWECPEDPDRYYVFGVTHWMPTPGLPTP